MGSKTFARKLTAVIHQLLPSCCALCDARQVDSICSPCLKEILELHEAKKCIMCGSQSPTWVCKYCFYAHWAFDQTIVLCQDTSRLLPLIQACNRFGIIAKLPAILYAWQVCNFRHMTPVDVIIPLPEDLQVSKNRGFWFALELAKKWSTLTKTPYKSDIIHMVHTGNASPQLENLPSFYINPLVTRMNTLHNLRVAIVMPHLLSEFVLHAFASLLKDQGVKWIAFWVLARDAKKDFY
jgi:predicted amidophosphoribosyltransferase